MYAAHGFDRRHHDAVRETLNAVVTGQTTFFLCQRWRDVSEILCSAQGAYEDGDKQQAPADSLHAVPLFECQLLCSNGITR